MFFFLNQHGKSCLYFATAANGMRPCKLPGCDMCSFVTGSPTFWGPAGVFNINDRLTCQDSKVVYAIICVKDDKVSKY